MFMMACNPDHAAPASPAQPVSTEGFIAATTDIQPANLPALIAAFDGDPVGVADRLERDIGGRSALTRYATAMIQHGQAESLGRQLARIQNQGEPLAQPQDQDGAVWYPRAEDAGFVTGGIGAVLATHKDALPAFAKGAGRSPPAADADLQAWLSEPATTLPRPARSAFDDAFRAAYRATRPD